MPAKKVTKKATKSKEELDTTSAVKEAAPKTPRAKAAPKAPAKKSKVKAKPEAETEAKSEKPIQQPVQKEQPIAKTPKFQGNYFYANGKRKTSIVRVRLYEKGNGTITVNDKTFETYFPVITDQDKILSPLRLTENLNTFTISIVAYGGGIHSQAEAIRNGIAKALIIYKPELRTVLKQALFLRRDSRIKERKKFGLRRARRAPQWSKR